MSGYCLGAGLEIAASCDLRVADATARVGMPSVIEVALLPRLMGWGRVARLVHTGEIIGARQAYEWRIFDSLVPGRSWTPPSSARWT